MHGYHRKCVHTHTQLDGGVSLSDVMCSDVGGWSGPPVHSMWRRPIGCLIFISHFPQTRPMIGGSLAENDLQLQASCGFRLSVVCMGMRVCVHR